MIYSLEGTPGTGKSLFLCQKIIPDFLKVRAYDGSITPVHIWHNIEGLRPELILSLLELPTSLLPYFHHIGEVVNEAGEVVEDKRYLQYFYYDPNTIEWEREKDEKGRLVWKPNEEKAKYLPLNSLVILDEVQNVFGSRDFAERYSKEAIKYLTRHRHYGHTIWWASQNVEQVDVTFRRNTQYVWFLESLENVALVGGGNGFKISKYEGWLAGNKTNIPPYAVEKVQKDSRFFACYRSHCGEKGQVKEVHYKTNMWTNSKGLKICALLLVVAVGVTIFRGNPLKNLTGSNLTTKTATTPPPPQSKGFSPFAGVGGVSSGSASASASENDVECVDNFFVNNGVAYYIKKGITYKVKKGGKYEICSDRI